MQPYVDKLIEMESQSPTKVRLAIPKKVEDDLAIHGKAAMRGDQHIPIEILYYEMPGGIRFPVGKAVRGAEPFHHTEGTTYPAEVTITDVGSRDD